MKVKFDIYQSILKPLRIDSEELKKEFLRSQRALRNLGKLNLNIFDTKSSILEVKEYVRVPKLIKALWKHHKVYMRDEIIYRFRIKIEYDEKFYEDIKKDFNINSNEFFEKELLPNDVKRRFYDLQMILNICRVGGFSYGMGFIKTSYGFDRLKNMKLYTSELFEYSMEKKWPNFENLGIRKTWNWYLHVQNPLGVEELSGSSISRAFNAFSYLYENSEGINKIFWAMVGIEAIYVRGKEGISQQIKEKAQLYLGEIQHFKKRLTKMYDFRSSFIHGSKNFPSYFHTADAIEGYEKFSEELFDVMLTAECLLIATIQKIAKEERDNLSFMYVIQN